VLEQTPKTKHLRLGLLRTVVRAKYEWTLFALTQRDTYLTVSLTHCTLQIHVPVVRGKGSLCQEMLTSLHKSGTHVPSDSSGTLPVGCIRR